jgi:arsenate reductase
MVDSLSRGSVMADAGQQKKYKILFLCSCNSARSILAEYFLRRMAPNHFEVFSAGASPNGQVNPLVLEILRTRYQIDASGARSKSWEEFREVHFDFVITVFDKAHESSPVFPGQPIIAHWGSDDPDAVKGGEEERRRVVKKVALEIYRRLGLFTCLPLASLDRLRLEAATQEIGRK